jgi:diguanylate cyclase (GGDEF)-like protein/PAS domain S-box-containing protein
MQSNDSDPNIGSKIYSEQVAHLYNHAPPSLVFTIFVGGVLALLQASLISNQVILIWYSILVLVTLARAILVYSYHRTKPQSSSIGYWHWAFVAGCALAGGTWGSSAIFLYPSNALEHQLFVIYVLTGVTAIAVLSLASSLTAYLSFLLPASLPMLIQLFSNDSPVSSAMAIMALCYLIALCFGAQGLSQTIVTSLMLRFDNHQMVKEIADRKRAEDALYLEKTRLQVTFSALAEAIIITTTDGTIEYLNPAAENISGWLDSQAREKNIEQVFSHVDEGTGQHIQTAIYDCLKNNARSTKNSLLIARDGKQRVIEEIATPLKDRIGNSIGAVAIIRDVTQAREHSRQLAYQASHDSLTNLPNRSLLCDRLEHAIAKAMRANRLVAVLYMDLDRFKQVNDSLGHAAGDKLLCHVAQLLRTSIREQDTVARLGGDEFVVVLEDLTYQDQATVVAQKIVDNLAAPSTIEHQEIRVRVSIGISVFPRDGDNVETLLKHADTAMFRTKKLAHENIQFYTDDMSIPVNNQLKLEQRLQHVVARDELELHYQPRVTMNSSKIIGLEALLRWRKSSDQVVSPAEFIHIAEETGSILDIGEWVLHTACEQAQVWHTSHHKTLRIAINLSVRQITTHCIESISNVLKETGLNPELMELEITESLFLNDSEHVIMVLRELKKLGVKLAIDDFGAGYSSLTYLKQFPVDILKIDQSFIHDIGGDPIGSAFIPAIIAMGHRLNLEVVAEGVENKIQRNYLNESGCDSFQGYCFSKPLSANAATNLLRNNT